MDRIAVSPLLSDDLPGSTGESLSTSRSSVVLVSESMVALPEDEVALAI